MPSKLAADDHVLATQQTMATCNPRQTTGSPAALQHLDPGDHFAALPFPRHLCPSRSQSQKAIMSYVRLNILSLLQVHRHEAIFPFWTSLPQIWSLVEELTRISSFEYFEVVHARF